MLKRIAIFACCTALLSVFVLPAAADQWDNKTKMTFSQPVELPGIVLPAGTYMFKLLNSPADRHIVQVFNENETHLYTTILAIPNHRLTPTGETAVRFEERRAGEPEAIKAWFYPGENFGQEFVYPKAKAAEIAKATNQPVVMTPVTPSELPPEELAVAPIAAITPEQKEIPLAEILTPAPPLVALAETAPEVLAPAELPKTASPVPLLVLMGISSLLLAAALRAISKVTA